MSLLRVLLGMGDKQGSGVADKFVSKFVNNSQDVA